MRRERLSLEKKRRRRRGNENVKAKRVSRVLKVSMRLRQRLKDAEDNEIMRVKS